MYPVSEAYKRAIRQNQRMVRIRGTITLKDNTTIEIDDDDILQGSLYVSEQCVAGEDIEIGNVYASELGLVLTSPPDNPYTLDGARIILNFGIETSEGVWEEVPLGYFYVTEIERRKGAVVLKALDGMILFDVDLTGVLKTGTPYELISSCCSKVGITLATNSSTMATFANGSATFTVPTSDKVQTCRDLIMWLCQLMGCFARMNRMGQLEIVPIKAASPVQEIFKDQRFSTDVSDGIVKITKVATKVGDTEYMQGSGDMLMVLEENPLLADKSETEINTILNNLLNQITTAEYVPFNVNYNGDPALRAGDWVKLVDVTSLQTEKETGTFYVNTGTFPAEVDTPVLIGIVTHSTWRYRGPHNIRAVGKSALVRKVQPLQQKAISSVQAVAKEAHELAVAANQSAQLINDAITGYVLIRKNEITGSNEILIMGNPDPAQARKVWRWNMGGLGYSDNVVGVDNPSRQYKIAITMDGAINADFVKAGTLQGNIIAAGSITADKLNVTSLSAISANLGTVTAGMLQGVNVIGGTIKTADAANRLEMSSGSFKAYYNSVKRVELDYDSLDFYNGFGQSAGGITAGETDQEVYTDQGAAEISVTDFEISTSEHGSITLYSQSSVTGKSASVFIRTGGKTVNNANYNGEIKLQVWNGSDLTSPYVWLRDTQEVWINAPGGVDVFGALDVAGDIHCSGKYYGKFGAEYISPNADLNNYKTPGFYYNSSTAQAATIANVPESYAFALVILQAATIIQIWIPYQSSRFYMRTWQSWDNVWTSWRRYNPI